MNIKRNLVISDLHIPDHNVKALDLVYAFIKEYKPNTLHILGDFVNFPTISRYPQDPNYPITLKAEIDMAKGILNKLIKLSNCEVIWYEGNHEMRMVKYINEKAPEIATLMVDGESLVSIPHIFGLKKLGVKYIYEQYLNKVVYHHGETIGTRSGMTADKNMLKFGTSVLSGHVHRLAISWRTFYDRRVFGMETGCLCNDKPYPYYGTMVKDWQLGLATVDIINGDAHPRIYPIINNSLIYGDIVLKV